MQSKCESSQVAKTVGQHGILQSPTDASVGALQTTPFNLHNPLRSLFFMSSLLQPPLIGCHCSPGPSAPTLVISRSFHCGLDPPILLISWWTTPDPILGSGNVQVPADKSPCEGHGVPVTQGSSCTALGHNSRNPGRALDVSG